MNRLPWKLYRYIGVEICVVFALALAALTSIYMIVIGLRGVSMGLTSSVVASWVTESIGFALYFTVPISLMIAGTLTYGRLVSDREYTAITACGLSPLHVLVPLGTLATVIGTIGLLVSGTVLPEAHYSQRNLSRFLLKQLEDLGNRRSGRLPINEEDGRLYYEEVREGTYLYGVDIRKSFPFDEVKDRFGTGGASKEADSGATRKEPATLPMILTARRAQITVDDANDKISMTLQDVHVKFADWQSKVFVESLGWRDSWQGFHLENYELEFDLRMQTRREGDLHDPELLARIDEMRDFLGQLQHPADGEPVDDAAVKKTIEMIREFKCEYWRRKALALSAFTLAFLGFPIPFVLRYRHRLAALFVASMVVVLVFYPLLMFGETLAVRYGISPMFAMLSGNMMVAAIATFLTGKLLIR